MLLLLRAAAVTHCHWKACGQVYLCADVADEAVSEAQACNIQSAPPRIAACLVYLVVSVIPLRSPSVRCTAADWRGSLFHAWQARISG